MRSCRHIDRQHAEALDMDKQATHFRKVQAELSRRVDIIKGKTACCRSASGDIEIRARLAGNAFTVETREVGSEEWTFASKWLSPSAAFHAARELIEAN